ARMMRRSPLLSAMIVLTFVVCIGANTAIFSLFHSVLLRPLPYPDPDGLLMVWESPVNDPTELSIVAAPNYTDWEKQNSVFERMAIYEYQSFNLSGDGEPEQVGGLRASCGLPEVLGVQPLLGRWFLPEEDVLGNNRVVVLSHGLWQRRFAGDRGILGRTVRVNQESHTVVGVMPPGFFFPSPRQALWVPIAFNPADDCRNCHSFFTVARLKTGVTVVQAGAAMDTLGRQLAAEYPQTNTGETVRITPMRTLWIENTEQMLLALLMAVGFVLLIGCVNIANLLLARGSTRQKELALRAALGAGRWRLTRQLLTESVLLSVTGAVLGALAARAAIPLLIGIMPGNLTNIPFRDISTITLDTPVLLFVAGMGLLTGLLAGLAPALQGGLANPGESLKESGARGATSRTGQRLRGALVGLEVALALVVLVGAALMIASMQRVLGVDPGLNAQNILAMDITLPQPDFYGPPVRANFCRDVTEHVGAIPGVETVSATSHLPVSGSFAGRGFRIEGRPAPPPGQGLGAGYALVCPDYFRTMEIPLLAGREFTDQDTTGALPVVIISDSLRRRDFPDEDPIGRRIRIGEWLTIVGVVGDIRPFGLDSKTHPYLYRVYSQAAWPSMNVVLRARSNPGTLAAPVKQALARVAPEQPVGDVETMEQVVAGSVAARRFIVLLLGAFSVVAVGLAAVGIYGVVSYVVARRTHELGIRLALGAQPRDLYRLVIGQAMAPVLLGIAAGLFGAAGLTRFLGSFLFQVSPSDPVALGGVTLLLGVVALLACALPARRAARVDPMVALRFE
ncbi:MAG TPA: ABC transporter permease, partial [Candidatus Acidoferrales bacterium]